MKGFKCGSCKVMENEVECTEQVNHFFLFCFCEEKVKMYPKSRKVLTLSKKMIKFSYGKL